MSRTKKRRGLTIKIAIIWIAIFMQVSFLLALKSASDPVTITVIPEVPKQGEPVIVTFNLNNPTGQTSITQYQFYANGNLLNTGAATLSPLSSKKYQYAYENPLEIGERVNFVIKAASQQYEYEKAISLPPYPPQIWSSFVSFASFSTSVMGSMSSMVYYETSFITQKELNIGMIISIVLIALLIYLEITQPLLREKTLTIFGSLRIRFSKLSTILFIIFMGMFFTKVVMALA